VGGRLEDIMTPREQFAAAVDQVLTYRPGGDGCVTEADVAGILAAADEYRAEGLSAFAAELDELAAMRRSGPDVTVRMAKYAQAALHAAAGMARQRARGAASEASGHAPASRQGESGPEPQAGAQSRAGGAP
jgi:hypothetical protein